jgi:hypothetical protein
MIAMPPHQPNFFSSPKSAEENTDELRSRAVFSGT